MLDRLLGKLRPAVTTVVLAATGAAAATLVVRGTPVRNVAGLTLAVLAPYAAVLSPVGVALAVRGRRRVLAVAATAITVASLGVQVCWYYRPGSAAAVEARSVRVLASNIRNGEADAESFVRLAAARADVIVVVELTPEALQRFSAAGIGLDFPHSQLIPAPLAGGIGIWSRFPLEPLPVPVHPAVSAPAALLKVPGVAVAPLVVAVHVKSPLAEGQDTVTEWDTGITHLGGQLDRFAATAGSGSVIVAGDFNATPDVRQFRDLLTGGYRDAVEQLGAGFAPTFPSDRWCPPLFTIDHVLTRNAAATAIEAVDVSGSDHRGLVADVAIPRGTG